MSGLSQQPIPSLPTIPSIIEDVKAGKVRGIARAITLLELGGPDCRTVLDNLKPLSHHASIIGITGYPGAGKSTLIDQLISVYRSQRKKIGILAVDTSSPFTGGAILGDRIRMQNHSLDEQVYIRSMATRGHRGGLAKATKGAIRVLEAAGFDVIVIETIGVGQEEGEIAQLAQTVVLVVVPGLGDDVQAMKAGILEIADIVVVNKADHQGTTATIQALQGWVPTVLPSVATKGEGIQSVVEAIAMHHEEVRSEK